MEAYRLAGVGMMIGLMPNGDERVTISVPGEKKRRAIEAEARAAVLTELRVAAEGMAHHFQHCGGYGCAEDRADDWSAVLALIDRRIAGGTS